MKADIEFASATWLDYRTLRSQGQEIAHPVEIGCDVWIGGAAVILPGVTMGDGAIVGAGSVAAGEIVAGNPARSMAGGYIAISRQPE